MRYDGESWLDAGWRRLCARLWPERQLILRSAGRVRTVSVPRRAQIVGLLAGLGIAGWLGYVTALYFDFEELLSGKERAIHASESAYRVLASEMALTRENFLEMAKALGEHRAELARAAERNDALRHSLAAAEQQLGNAEADRKRAHERSAKLAGRLAALEQQFESAEQHNARLQADLHAAAHKLSAAAIERAQIEREREAMRAKIKDLEGRLAQVQNLQERLVHRMADSMAKDIEAAERLLGQLGIPPTEALRRPARGVGGPYIPVRPGDSADPYGRQIAALLSRLDRRDDLHGMINSLPLGAPLAKYTVGSGFGRRLDPFNGSAAFHQGVDLTAEKKTPVHAPAAGTVINVATDGRLGRLVEIDHGHTLVTRYGHLSASNVRIGQKIAKGDVLGFVGSTGRSTGPHLHYEVLVNGRPVDPMRFMKARHVQKG